MTPMSVGGDVRCALTRLLRPEADPLVEALDAWPLTVADVLGESGLERGVRRSPGSGLGTALERLLRPDRQLMVLAIDALDFPDVVGQPPGSANAA